MCLQLFGHRCWQYNPDLSVLFPLREMCMALEEYLELFLLSLKNAPKITKTSILSVAYCRTRGAASYPFLIVYLQHPGLRQFPVRLKLQGFNGPATIQVANREPSYDTPGEGSTFSIAFVGETLMELVGTWRYDVLRTMTFKQRLNDAGQLEPSIVDLLTLTVLLAQCEHTREGCPVTLFLALKNLTCSVNRVSHLKFAVIDAFHTRRQCMQEEIDIRSGYRDYIDATQTLQLRAENAELWERTALLQEEVFHLKLEATLPTRVSEDANETI
ncbi:hypothetical protein DFH08DRAFT_887856 [Mycena albidolilacea]|uniref:Uncharacterized protein n=1 Tax=Mycena albidolilacea TaxID=1033008 RepID=A0AAD7EI10_9AGAR|nr:hypothetical protein DFH08DRAFT_887856 [Mycena albidolilacea]